VPTVLTGDVLTEKRDHPVSFHVLVTLHNHIYTVLIHFGASVISELNFITLIFSKNSCEACLWGKYSSHQANPLASVQTDFISGEGFETT